MTLKTLFLGGAAVLLVGGAAQAADLAAAEPVNYVKVCDAFGPGYYYAPGTDTCIKIGGHTRFEIKLNKSPDTSAYPDAKHYFKTQMELNVTAKSMTEYGPLVGFINIEAIDTINGGTIFINTATLSLGPLSAGHDWSIFSPPPYTFTSDTGSEVGNNGAVRTNFIGLNWAMNGFGFAISAEDYRTRDGGTSTGNIPDIVANITGGSFGGPFRFIIAGGYGQRTFGASWGLNAAVHVAVPLAAGDDLLLGVTYSGTDDGWINGLITQPFYVGVPVTQGSVYSIYGSFVHFWTPKVSTAITADWRSTSHATNIVGNITFRPVKNFSIQGEVAAAGTDFGGNTFTGLIRLQRDFP